MKKATPVPLPNRRERRWATKKQAADYLGVSPRTFRDYLAQNMFPVYVLPGSGTTARMERVDLNEVDDALEAAK